MSDGWVTGISDRPTTIAPLKAVLKKGTFTSRTGFCTNSVSSLLKHFYCYDETQKILRLAPPVNYMIITAHLIGKYSNFLGIIKADSFRSRNLFLSSLKKILVKALPAFGDPLDR